LFSRLDDKEHGSIILVMQRLHEHDLSGHLIEKGGFDVIALPAIAVENERWRLSDGRTFKRKVGQALHPERESLDILAEIKASQGSRPFQSQYQQAPVPADGNLFKRQWIRRYEAVPDLTQAQVIQCWDTATGIGKANDYSVCTTWAIINKLFYLLDVHRGRWECTDLLKQVSAMAERWRATTVLIEDASSGAALLQVLRPSCSFNLISRKPRLEKHVRASAQTACFESGRAILPHEAPWLAEYERELLGFPSAKYDDQVDSTTMFLDYAQQRTAYEVPIVGPIVGSWKPAWLLALG
jgi:predicted phage terminase large subunit-like protein